jgi:hypothetical protein
MRRKRADMALHMENNRPFRESEWFVPRFGPPRFRTFAGLLFLPYTGMVLSFSVIGSMLARHVHWERVFAVMAIYFLGLGIGAHALDALGSKGRKPWGDVFTRRQLWLAATLSLLLAYGVAAYYIVRYVPLLLSMAVMEGFFVFAYNLELFRGRFHTDTWFALSWGSLPVLSGYIIQTNTVSVPALVVAFSMALFSLTEIKASRPYKELRQRFSLLKDEEKSLALRYEAILKSVSMGIILLGGGFLAWRIGG